MKRFCLATGCFFCIVTAAWPQGYRLEENKLVVDETHWSSWHFPAGTVALDADGVKPLYVRSQTNAVLDAPRFNYGKDQRGGIRGAGSNPDAARFIIDGRADTFWEPESGAPLEDLWVEIDLGRLVWVKKVVLMFVGAGEGDPFLQFNLLTSNGEPAFSQSPVLSYLRAGRTEGLNKTQRIFEFDLEPSLNADPGFAGNLIQFIQVVATASAGGRAEKIGRAVWQRLPLDDRGDVLYFRRESSGVLRQVDQLQHEAIVDPQQIGPVEYYRRERPRLAEVEVWSAGDNISLGALNRGGEIVGFGNLGAERLTVDGAYNTMWGLELGYGLGGGAELGEVFKEPDRHVFFDLGAWFWIDRSLILFTKIGGGFPNYVLSLSDGRRAPDGSLIYTPLIVRGSTDNLANDLNRSFFLQENSFDLIKARHFKMDYHLVHHSLRSGMREIQLFGRGFLPQLSLRSPLIDLGRNPRVLSSIEWEAEIPPGTELKFRTRSGNQLKTEIHYYTNTGVEVAEKKYRKLLSFQKGDSVVTTIPGEGWSNWSRFYSLPGVAVTSPSPRQFALVEATLTTEDPDQAVALLRLSIRLDKPLASRLTGEIAPQVIEQNGRIQSFSLFLQSQFQGGNFGFDQLLVELPPGTHVALEDVAVGTESELAAGGGLIYGLDELVRYDTGADSLWVKLPATIEQGQKLVALRFAAELFLASNPFTFSVGLGEGKEQVWQRVDAGDASSLGEGSGMTVFLPFDSGILGAVEVSSNPFTPNGDGINDVVEFAFPVFKILGSKMLLLEVFGLDGMLVQRLEKQVVNIAGRQRVVWDGRDFSNELAPPGLYLCRLGLDVDAPDEEVIVTKLVASVY